MFILFSIQYRFLDIFVPGSWHGIASFDFVSVPRSFLNLLQGKSIFNTFYLSYGSIATPYFYHPALSLLVGSWLSLFKPNTAFTLFVYISIIILIYSAFLISKQTNNILIKRLSYFLILCSFPTYLMLWNAQMHVFTVLAVTLVIVSLLKIFKNQNHKNINLILLAGLLISFFSKPIIILFLPVLFFTKETRCTALLSFGIYILVSLLFIFLPVLNPEGIDTTKLFDKNFHTSLSNNYDYNEYLEYYNFDNIIHWIHIIKQSKNVPTNNFELFSFSYIY